MIIDFLATIFYFLLALGILVAFHEFGHYWVAIKCGVKVEKFSIGFGKPLLTWKRKETEFMIAMIPLGGYVKMQGEDAREQTKSNSNSAVDETKSFDNQSVTKRIAIVAAGPIANFVLAVIFFWVLALAGKTAIEPVIGTPVSGSVAEQAGLQSYDEIVSIDGHAVDSWSSAYQQIIERIGDSGEIVLEVRPFETTQDAVVKRLPIDRWLATATTPKPMQDLGISLYMPPSTAEIKQLVAGSAAANSGFQVGDKIIEVNGQSINSWNEWREWVRRSPNISLAIDVLRNDNEYHLLTLIPKRYIEENGQVIGQAGVIGQSAVIAESMLKKIRYNTLQAIGVGFADAYSAIRFTLVSIKKLIVGQLSPKTLGGPVSIAKYAGQTASVGWQSYVNLLALLSISLGVLNLLPVPVLDGGRLLFYSYEVLMRKPLSLKIQNVAMRLGLLLVTSLMVFALVNDISRF